MADLLGSGRLQLGQDFHGVPCMFDRYEEMVVVRAGDDIATDACLWPNALENAAVRPTAAKSE